MKKKNKKKKRVKARGTRLSKSTKPVTPNSQKIPAKKCNAIDQRAGA